jgi:hypothetical protein
MSLTAKQLETVHAINKANAEFWSTPEAHATQRVIAELQSNIAVAAGLKRKKAKPATAGRKKLGDDTRAKVRAAARKLPPHTKRVEAAKKIARLIHRSEETTKTILKKEGLFSRRR